MVLLERSAVVVDVVVDVVGGVGGWKRLGLATAVEVEFGVFGERESSGFMNFKFETGSLFWKSILEPWNLSVGVSIGLYFECDCEFVRKGSVASAGLLDDTRTNDRFNRWRLKSNFKLLYTKQVVERKMH